MNPPWPGFGPPESNVRASAMPPHPSSSSQPRASHPPSVSPGQVMSKFSPASSLNIKPQTPLSDTLASAPALPSTRQADLDQNPRHAASSASTNHFPTLQPALGSIPYNPLPPLPPHSALSHTNGPPRFMAPSLSSGFGQFQPHPSLNPYQVASSIPNSWQGLPAPNNPPNYAHASQSPFAVVSNYAPGSPRVVQLPGTASKQSNSLAAPLHPHPASYCPYPAQSFSHNQGPWNSLAPSPYSNSAAFSQPLPAYLQPLSFPNGSFSTGYPTHSNQHLQSSTSAVSRPPGPEAKPKTSVLSKPDAVNLHSGEHDGNQYSTSQLVALNLMDQSILEYHQQLLDNDLVDHELNASETGKDHAMNDIADPKSIVERNMRSAPDDRPEQARKKSRDKCIVGSLPNSNAREFCIPRESIDLSAGERALNEVVHKYTNMRCGKCGSAMFDSHNDPEVVARRWVDQRPALLGQMLCSYCLEYTCGGCFGSARVGLTQDVMLHTGEISWCCEESRLFTIWFLLCAYKPISQRLSNLREEKATVSTVKPPERHQSKRPRGVGYTNDANYGPVGFHMPPEDLEFAQAQLMMHLAQNPPSYMHLQQAHLPQTQAPLNPSAQTVTPQAPPFHTNTTSAQAIPDLSYYDDKKKAWVVIQHSNLNLSDFEQVKPNVGWNGGFKKVDTAMSAANTDGDAELGLTDQIDDAWTSNGVGFDIKSDVLNYESGLGDSAIPESSPKTPHPVYYDGSTPPYEHANNSLQSFGKDGSYTTSAGTSSLAYPQFPTSIPEHLIAISSQPSPNSILPVVKSKWSTAKTFDNDQKPSPAHHLSPNLWVTASTSPGTPHNSQNGSIGMQSNNGSLKTETENASSNTGSLPLPKLNKSTKTQMGGAKSAKQKSSLSGAPKDYTDPYKYVSQPAKPKVLGKTHKALTKSTSKPTSQSDTVHNPIYGASGMPITHILESVPSDTSKNPNSGVTKRSLAKDLVVEKLKMETKKHDPLIVGILKLLCLALPSIHRGETLNSKMSESLLPMMMHSVILDDAAALFRNDAIEDAMDRSDVFDAFYDLVSQLAKHPMTTNAILKDRPSKEFRRSSETYKPELIEKPREYVPSVAASMENLAKRSCVVMASARKTPTDFEDGTSKSMLTVCRKVVDLGEYLMACSVSASAQQSHRNKTANETGNEMQWEHWQKNNCMLDVPDDAILNTHAFATEACAVTQSPKGRMKRIVQEAAVLSTSLPLGIFVRSAASRPDVIKVLIVGPRDTPYECGLFEFDAWLPPKYPLDPPKFRFKTTGGGRIRFNPNLYRDGKVCLSLLNTWTGGTGERWTAQSTLLQVLLSIQAMIFCEQPYYNEPGQDIVGSTKAAALYNHAVHSGTVTAGMHEWLVQHAENSGIWHDVVEEHFKHNREKFLPLARRWLHELDKVLKDRRVEEVLTDTKIRTFDLALARFDERLKEAQMANAR